jgi:type I restriction enzyme, S subunit
MGILWSAQSYRPDITAALRKIRSMPWRSLAALCVNAIGPGPHPTFGRAGHPCLKTKNVLGIVVDATEVDFVDPADAKRWPHYLIDRENLVLNVTGAGSIGRVGMYFGTDRPLTNQHLAKLAIAPGSDAGFVCAFLSSWWGERALEQGISGSTGQLNLVNDHIRQVPIPTPDPLVQRYIGDKVRQAERLRERARSLTALSTRLVESMIDGSLSEADVIATNARLRHAALPAFAGARVNRAASERRQLAFRTSDLDPGRIDPWHHQPSFVEARASIARSGSSMLLGDMIDAARGIRGGATPLGALYPDTGKIRFFRTADVHDLMIHRGSAGFLSFEQDSELARSRLAAGDVLLTITGVHFGQSGVVSAMHLPGNISQHSVRFALSGHDAHYLVAYLSCHYGQQMIWREAYGATRPAIDYPGVAEILVRTPEPKVQNCIGDLVRSLESCTSAADSLVSAAKLLVERLVEGVISEADLVAAQKAIEAGGRSADREIMTALRQSDGPDTKPLIPDIDALYALLDESENKDA